MPTTTKAKNEPAEAKKNDTTRIFKGNIPVLV